MGIFDPDLDTDRLVQELKSRGFDRNDILILGGKHDSEERSEVAEPEELTTLFRNRGIPHAEAGRFGGAYCTPIW